MSATYEPFSLADVQKVLSPECGWKPAPVDPNFPVKEHVLDWTVPDGPAKGQIIRVYTSVLLATGMTRSVGSDAIRVCVPKRLKSVTVNRTAGWQERVKAACRERLQTLQEMLAPTTAPTVEAAKPAIDYSSIAALLERAGLNGLKWPKITLTQGEVTVRFQLAGPASKFAGQVMVNNGEPFNGARVYFGRIEKGALFAVKAATPEVRALIDAFAQDPIGTAVTLGKKSGHCQFCLQKLSTEESLSAGYGPVCAKHWGLPWGKKGAA